MIFPIETSWFGDFPALRSADQVFDIGHDSEDDVGHISSAVRALNVDSVDGRWAQGVPVSYS